MLEGPSFKLYKKIIKSIPNFNLIASGGISKIDEFPKLKEMGCEGVILGKAIYENRISLKQIEQFLIEK
jgi:phosphoribosylformimino-5-aminoimidazole carboxamide ribotide isomerase